MPYELTIPAQLADVQSGIGIIGPKPTGNDQSAELQTFFRDTAGVRNGIDLGEGDYILGSPISIYARDKLNSGQGVGLSIKGAGPGRTRLLYTGDKAQHAVTITDPTGGTSPAVARRNYLNKISDMSLLACDGAGNLLTEGNFAGSGMFFGPVSGLGYGGGACNHTSILERVVFEGWDSCLTLDDVTLMELRQVWFRDFVTAGIRFGGNIDMFRAFQCMFGSEQASGFRNTATAIQTAFVGINGSTFTGGDDNIKFEQCWFMKIGTAINLGADNNDNAPIVFDQSYFEDVRQVLVGTNATKAAELHLLRCLWSKIANDDASLPKVQMPAVDGCKILVEGCKAPTSSGPLGGWFAFYRDNSRVDWRDNSMGAGSVGHVLYRRSGQTAIERAIPDFGRHNVTLGGNSGLWWTSGELLKFSNGAATGAVSVRPETQGNDISLTTSGVITSLDVPLFAFNPGTRLKVTIRATLATHTVAWHSRFAFHTPFVQPTTDNTVTFLEFEQRGNKWVQVSGPNVWFTP